jgi:hypothetical protein
LSLASSAGDLSREQGDLDQMLTARRDSLESLVNSIKVRREDLEGLMHSFAERIEDSFEKAATRARDIGAFLAESSQSTGGMIDQQFSGIRANIEQERESTAAAMRAAAEQANAGLQVFSDGHGAFQSRRRSCAKCRARSGANSATREVLPWRRRIAAKRRSRRLPAECRRRSDQALRR